MAAIYALAGFGLSSWLSRLSDFMIQFDLSPRDIGMFLLVQEGCGLAAMQVLSWLITKRGQYRFTLYSGLLFGFGVCLPGLAWGVFPLTVAVAVLGAGFGAMDISMNSRADSIEKHYNVRLMGYCHAFFSLGGVLGALLAIMVIKMEAPLWLHFSYAGIMIAAASYAAWRRLPPVPLKGRQTNFKLSIPGKPLLPLCAMAACIAIVEGSMADWAGVYIRRELGASADNAALCYALFSAGMFAGRLASDPLIARFGSPFLMRWSSLFAAAAFALFLLSARLPLAMTGLFGCGVGIACSWPIFIRAAARTPGQSPSQNIAAVMTFAYGGFVLVPALTGLIAEALGLRLTLWIVVIACMALVRLAPFSAAADSRAVAA